MNVNWLPYTNTSYTKSGARNRDGSGNDPGGNRSPALGILSCRKQEFQRADK
jgi:hypothetical protein